MYQVGDYCKVSAKGALNGFCGKVISSYFDPRSKQYIYTLKRIRGESLERDKKIGRMRVYKFYQSWLTAYDKSNSY